MSTSYKSRRAGFYYGVANATNAPVTEDYCVSDAKHLRQDPFNNTDELIACGKLMCPTILSDKKAFADKYGDEEADEAYKDCQMYAPLLGLPAPAQSQTPAMFGRGRKSQSQSSRGRKSPSPSKRSRKSPSPSKRGRKSSSPSKRGRKSPPRARDALGRFVSQ